MTSTVAAGEIPSLSPTPGTDSDPPVPLRDHLREARTRLIRVALLLLIGALAGYALAAPLLDLLRIPVLELAESRDASLNYDSLTGAFDLRLRLALIIGVVLSSPLWIYETFAFVLPGLNRRERRHLLGFLGGALPLFALGCTVGFGIFPHVVELLAGFASAEDSTILSASYYVDFVMKLVLAIGVAFVMPVFLVLLNFLGLLSARVMLKGWRIAVVVITLFCALVTPAADVMSMFLVAVPMCGLFFAAVGISAVHDRFAARRAAIDPEC